MGQSPIDEQLIRVMDVSTHHSEDPHQSFKNFMDDIIIVAQFL